MRLVKYIRRYALYIVLLFIILFFSLLTPTFLSVNNFLNVARQVSMIGIAAVGATFVILVKGIDLSIGSQVSFLNILCCILMTQYNLNPWLVLCIGLMIAPFLGFINGMISTKMKIPAFITTLAAMTIYQGLAYFMSNGLPIYGMPSEFKVLGQGYLGPIPIPIIIMVIIFMIGALVLNKTKFGRHIYAVGGNEKAASLFGVNVDRIKIMAYTVGGITTGIASMILLSRVNSGQPYAGGGFEFSVITAVFLGGVSLTGGVGSISNVIAGVVIMGIFNNGLILLNMSEYSQMVAKGVILLLAVGYSSIQSNFQFKLFKKRI